MEKLIKLHQTRQYLSALSILQEGLEATKQQPKYHQWFKKQHPIILTSLAWTEIQKGQCQTALPRLTLSYSITKQPATVKGLAYCSYLLKDYNASEDYILEYLKTNPNDKDLKGIYSEILESQLRFDEATVQLEGIVKTSKSQGKNPIKKRLDSMREKATESFNQATIYSENFTITYDLGSQDDLVNTAMNLLEQAVLEFTEHWRLVHPQNPIEVLLYPAQRFNKLVSYGPKWAQGLFDGRIRIQVKESYTSNPGSPEFKRILRHELVHALMSQLDGQKSLPYWFNEGIAEYLSCPMGCRHFTFPVTPGDFLDKKKFLINFTKQPHSNIGALYSQSLYLIRTIVHATKETHDQPVQSIIVGLKSKAQAPILEPIGLDFGELYSIAKKNWNSRLNYSDHSID